MSTVAAPARSSSRPGLPSSGARKARLRIAEVSIPVALVKVVPSRRGEQSFPIHAGCLERLSNGSVCPKHGLVPEDQVERVFEDSETVVSLTPEERTVAVSDVIAIDRFDRLDKVSPLQLDAAYFVRPRKGALTLERYAWLVATLGQLSEEAGGVVAGMGQLALFREPCRCLVWVEELVLHLATLHFTDDLRSPAEIVQAVNGCRVPTEALELGRLLIEAKHAAFPRQIRRGKTPLRQLVEEKARQEGDLLDDLRRSVPRGRKGRTA